MKTALLIIATGERYHQFIRPLLESADRYFVRHTPLLWTDSLERYTPEQMPLTAEPWPGPTLHRYHTFYSHAGRISEFDQAYYVDVDMKFVSQVYEEDIFSSGITATIHPGFAVGRFDPGTGGWVPTYGTPERRQESKAFIGPHKTHEYYCGGFNGGDSKAYLRMADTIRKNVDLDRDNGITALWHDESHLNHYLMDTRPAKVLSPSFCYPEEYDGGYGWAPETYKPVLLALDKRKYA